MSDILETEIDKIKQLDDPMVFSTRYKVILAGEGAVGKTTMSQRFLGKPELMIPLQYKYGI